MRPFYITFFSSYVLCIAHVKCMIGPYRITLFQWSKTQPHTHIVFSCVPFRSIIAPFLFWYIVCEPRCVCFNLAHQCHFAALFVRLVRPHCCANVDGYIDWAASISLSLWAHSRGRARALQNTTLIHFATNRTLNCRCSFFSFIALGIFYLFEGIARRMEKEDETINEATTIKKTKQKSRSVHRLWMCFFLR